MACEMLGLRICSTHVSQCAIFGETNQPAPIREELVRVHWRGPHEGCIGGVTSLRGAPAQRLTRPDFSAAVDSNDSSASNGPLYVRHVEEPG